MRKTFYRQMKTMQKELKTIKQMVKKQQIELSTALAMIKQSFAQFDLNYLYEDVLRCVRLETELSKAQIEIVIDRSINLLKYIHQAPGL